MKRLIARVLSAAVGGGAVLIAAGQSPAPGLAVAELFAPGVVSTDRAESAPAFSPDGREFYFSRADERGRRVILVSRRDGTTWATPRPLSFTTAQFDDSKATLSVDGQTMVFASNRPVPGMPPSAPNFLNLWMSHRSGAGWSEPQPIGPEVNTASDEDFPFLAADGTLWFASNRSGKPTDYRIYRSRLDNGRFQRAELFTSAIDSGFGDAVCYVAPDERYLLFMSMRPGGTGAIDLYVSSRENDGAWGPGVNLGASVNSPALDWFATVTPDRRYLVFATDRSGAGDIYRVDAKVIEAARTVSQK